MSKHTVSFEIEVRPFEQPSIAKFALYINGQMMSLLVSRDGVEPDPAKNWLPDLIAYLEQKEFAGSFEGMMHRMMGAQS